MSGSTQSEVKSQELYARARRSLAGGISHEYRFEKPTPIYMERARGAHMWDVAGRKYIDYCMGSASMLLGHAYPDVVDAITAQAALGTFHANNHYGEIEWAEILQALYPSAERVRFVSSGTEATMLAVRLARAHTGRTKILRFEGHYHGWHDYLHRGAAAPYDQAGSAGIPSSAVEATVVCPIDVSALADLLRREPDIAAIVCEASGASYGTVPLPANFLADLRKLADEFCTVLIFDEVITGFRWSPGGVQAIVGVTPDLTTLAKVLTGGLPGGAVVGREAIMRLLDPETPVNGKAPAVSHKGTFNGNPLVAAAAVAALKVIRTGEPQRLADARAAELRSGMQRVLDEHQVAGAAYGESSTWHLYFGKRDIAGLTTSQLKGVPKDTVKAFRWAMKSRGLDMMSYLGGVTSSAHTAVDIDETLNIFGDAIRDLVAKSQLPRS
jgi:glutamate-1-semialdehyde 2,1-aminomutase